MSYKDIEQAAKDQGWRIERTKKGLMFKAPNGRDQVLWHLTPSDRRAVLNFLTLMKAAGLEWPPPKKGR